MKNGRIAIPSNGKGGLDATRSGHFGHCDVFTFIDVENGEINKFQRLKIRNMFRAAVWCRSICLPVTM